MHENAVRHHARASAVLKVHQSLKRLPVQQAQQFRGLVVTEGMPVKLVGMVISCGGG